MTQEDPVDAAQGYRDLHAKISLLLSDEASLAHECSRMMPRRLKHTTTLYKKGKGRQRFSPPGEQYNFYDDHEGASSDALPQSNAFDATYDGTMPNEARIKPDELRDVTQYLINTSGCRHPATLERVTEVFSGFIRRADGLTELEFRGYIACVLTQILRELESRCVAAGVRLASVEQATPSNRLPPEVDHTIDNSTGDPGSQNVTATYNQVAQHQLGSTDPTQEQQRITWSQERRDDALVTETGPLSDLQLLTQELNGLTQRLSESVREPLPPTCETHTVTYCSNPLEKYDRNGLDNASHEQAQLQACPEHEEDNVHLSELQHISQVLDGLNASMQKKVAKVEDDTTTTSAAAAAAAPPAAPPAPGATDFQCSSSCKQHVGEFRDLQPVFPHAVHSSTLSNRVSGCCAAAHIESAEVHGGTHMLSDIDTHVAHVGHFQHCPRSSGGISSDHCLQVPPLWVSKGESSAASSAEQCGASQRPLTAKDLGVEAPANSVMHQNALPTRNVTDAAALGERLTGAKSKIAAGWQTFADAMDKIFVPESVDFGPKGTSKDGRSGGSQSETVVRHCTEVVGAPSAFDSQSAPTDSGNLYARAFRGDNLTAHPDQYARASPCVAKSSTGQVVPQQPLTNTMTASDMQVQHSPIIDATCKHNTWSQSEAWHIPGAVAPADGAHTCAEFGGDAASRHRTGPSTQDVRNLLEFEGLPVQVALGGGSGFVSKRLCLDSSYRNLYILEIDSAIPSVFFGIPGFSLNELRRIVHRSGSYPNGETMLSLEFEEGFLPVKLTSSALVQSVVEALKCHEDIDFLQV